MHPNQIDVMNHYEVVCPTVARMVGDMIDSIIGGEYDGRIDAILDGGCREISATIRREMNGNEDFDGPVPTPDFVLMWCVAQSTFKVSEDILRELEEFEC